MIIVQGDVVMVEADRETVIGPGECFSIPKGRRCIWNQAGYLKKIMVPFDADPGQPGDGSRPIQKVNRAMSPTAPPLAQPGAAPQQAEAEVYCDQSDRFRVGPFHATPGARPASPWSVNEVIHILTGNVHLTGAYGTTHSFSPGDTILITAGASIARASTGGLMENYCSCAPAEHSQAHTIRCINR